MKWGSQNGRLTMNMLYFVNLNLLGFILNTSNRFWQPEILLLLLKKSKQPKDPEVFSQLYLCCYCQSGKIVYLLTSFLQRTYYTLVLWTFLSRELLHPIYFLYLCQYCKYFILLCFKLNLR